MGQEETSLFIVGALPERGMVNVEVFTDSSLRILDSSVDFIRREIDEDRGELSEKHFKGPQFGHFFDYPQLGWLRDSPIHRICCDNEQLSSRFIRRSFRNALGRKSVHAAPLIKLWSDAFPPATVNSTSRIGRLMAACD